MIKQKKNIKWKPFSTKLPEETIKAIKFISVQKGKKNYEIVKEALDAYIAKDREKKRARPK